jgi:hypothetical protein
VTAAAPLVAGRARVVSGKGDAMSDYNYHSFTPEHVAEGMDDFRHALHVGDRVPDFGALTPEGEAVQLSEHLRQAEFTLMEFGSLT